MLLGILKSKLAGKINVQIIGVFVKMTRYFVNAILNILNI